MGEHTKGYKKKRHQQILDTVGKNILILRTQKKFSVKKLAELAEIEEKMLYNYERGLVDISASMIAILAEALGVEPHTLLIPHSS